MTLREIIAAAAARFDRRPLYRASVEAQAELTRARQGTRKDDRMTTEITINWQPDGEYQMIAEVPDPQDPQHSVYKLRALGGNVGGVWYIWGNRRGINVAGNARDIPAAMESAERVLRTIVTEDYPL